MPIDSTGSPFFDGVRNILFLAVNISLAILLVTAAYWRLAKTKNSTPKPRWLKLTQSSLIFVAICCFVVAGMVSIVQPS